MKRIDLSHTKPRTSALEWVGRTIAVATATLLAAIVILILLAVVKALATYLLS